VPSEHHSDAPSLGLELAAHTTMSTINQSINQSIKSPGLKQAVLAWQYKSQIR